MKSGWLESGRQQRRNLGIGRLQRVIGIRAIHRLEGEVCAFEQQPRFLERGERVLESRGRLLVADRGDLGLLLGNPGEQRGKIVAVLDAREIGSLEG